MTDNLIKPKARTVKTTHVAIWTTEVDIEPATYPGKGGVGLSTDDEILRWEMDNDLEYKIESMQYADDLKVISHPKIYNEDGSEALFTDE